MAVGKTSMLKSLKKNHPTVTVDMENIDTFVLQHYVRDPVNNGLYMELDQLNSRCKSWLKMEKEDSGLPTVIHIQERSPWDCIPFIRANYDVYGEENCDQEAKKETLESVVNMVCKRLKSPQMVIYVTCTATEQRERSEERGIEEVKDQPYLESLNYHYEKWLRERKRE